METIISLVVLSLLIAASLVTYHHKRVKTRQFLLSEQIYPAVRLSVIVEKFQSNITHVMIQLMALEPVNLVDISIELINRKREFNHYDLISEGLILKPIENMLPNDIQTIKIDYPAFKNLLETGDLPFRTFRFVATDKINRKFKSHELGLNKKWQLLRMDSGNYN